MERIIFWNNKGGTGKTSLAFQTICHYAEINQTSRVLVIDVCPQANLSELMLGGLHQSGSNNLLMRQGATPRATLGGYFQMRLPSPYSPPNFTPMDFITIPSKFNANIPTNINLLCGDPLLELQANAMSTLANNQIPGINTWVAVIDWLNDFLANLDGSYDIIFLDANPSFSIYTQIALAAANKLMIPVMADDSSRRAIQNAFSLIYGLKLPSEIYTRYAFAEKLKEASRPLPKVHRIIKNRITQYMGPASAYATVLNAIDDEIKILLQNNPNIFTFNSTDTGIINVRDFQTTGVVSYARGCPFFKLNAGRVDLCGQRVAIKEAYRQLCMEDIRKIVTESLS